MEAIRPFLRADGEVLGCYHRDADRYVLLVQEHPLTLPILATLLAVAVIDFRSNHGDDHETLVTCVGREDGGVETSTFADRAELAVHVPAVSEILQRGMSAVLHKHRLTRWFMRHFLRAVSKLGNVRLSVDNSHAGLQLAILRSRDLRPFHFVDVEVDARVDAMTDHQLLHALRKYVDAAYRETR